MKYNRLKIAVIGITILFVMSGFVPGVSSEIATMDDVEKVEALEIENSRFGSQETMRTSMGNTPWSMTEVLSTESSDDSGNPSLAVDADGIIHVAWCDWHAQDIFYKKRLPDGSWTVTEVVSTESTEYSFAPSLAVEPDGTVHVAWMDTTDLFDEYDTTYYIFYKKKPRGSTWSDNPTEYVSTETASASVHGPWLAVEPDGSVHVVWVDKNHADEYHDYDIWYKMKPSGGSWPTGPYATELVSTESDDHSRHPSLAVDTGGNVHIAWQDWTNYGGSGDDKDIFYKMKPRGGIWTTTEVVSIESTEPSLYPSLAVDPDDPDGIIHVAWKEWNEGNDEHDDIFYKNKSLDGNWPTYIEVVSTESTTYIGRPCLTIDTYKAVHVAWEDYTDYDGSNSWDRDIVYKMKASDGSWSTFPTEIVSSESTDSSKSVSLTVDLNGTVHVVWKDKTNFDDSGTDYDIFYKRRGGNWTFVVYMDGDNNLEGALISDFLEMSHVGSDRNISIVVLFDRIDGYDTSYGDWKDARRGIINHGDVPSDGTDGNPAWGESIGEVNMGDPNTLVDFVNWATTNFPASNYALILEDHGSGSLEGACYDNTSNGDYLSVKEFGNALEAIPLNMDLFGFDCCLMGMIECAHEVKDEASVYVASEDLEPGQGWPYDTILQGLVDNPDWTATELGSHIVDCYSVNPGRYNTLSAVDLTDFHILSTAVSTFASNMKFYADYSNYTKLQTHRNNTRYFGEDYYRDLGTFLSNVAGDTTIHIHIRNSAQNALSIYNDAIINNFGPPTSQGPATGLSIYFQEPGTAPNATYDSSNLDFCAYTLWDEFLHWWQRGPKSVHGGGSSSPTTPISVTPLPPP